MTGAVESGLQPTEADLCNPQTCSGLLEGLLLLLLADVAAAWRAAQHAAVFKEWQAELDRAAASVLQASCFG